MSKSIDRAIGRQHFRGATSVHESADRNESLVSHLRALSRQINGLAVVPVRLTGNPDLTFDLVGAANDTLVRDAGSWTNDGFAVGDVITVSGSASNDGTLTVLLISTTTNPNDTLEFAGDVLTDEVGVSGVSVVSRSVAVLTDSSGGTAGAVYKSGSSGAFSDNDLTGLTTGVQSAALNSAADTYMDAYREIAAKANEALAFIGVGTVDEGPGAAADGTIAAVTVAVTANTGNADAATFASAKALRADVLHAQRLAIHSVDDLREAVGLSRVFLKPGLGRYAFSATETLVFADANPDTITRDVGSWAADGFLEGDVVRVNGTLSNNGVFTIAGLTATVITLVAADALAAESLTTAEAEVASVEAERAGQFPGRLEGGDTLDIDGAPTGGGSGWDLVFETGTSDISDAVDGADATSAVLKTEVDALLAELRDNVAFLADNVDASTGVSVGTLGIAAMRE